MFRTMKRVALIGSVVVASMYVGDKCNVAAVVSGAEEGYRAINAVRDSYRNSSIEERAEGIAALVEGIAEDAADRIHYLLR